MPQLTRLDRVRGCFLGLAIGDALGAPLEGLSAQQIKAHYSWVADFVDGARAWKKKPYRWRLPGLYSDDTQQALALCDVLLECGAIDPDRLAALYLGLATPKGSYVGAHRGVGRSFRNVLTKLEQGYSPRETGQDSAGIGAAMRIAPVALYHAKDDAEGLFGSLMAASLMTHRDIRSLAGASAVLHAVRRLVDGEEREPRLLFLIASDVKQDECKIAERYPEVASLAQHRHSLSNAIARMERLLDLPRERALAALVEEANRHGADPVCRRATMGFPPACIPTCLYLLLTADNFADAIEEVVNLGGDADTTGAILGALAGAHYGLDAIPEHWLGGLQNRDAIDLRAQALARGSADGLDIPCLIAREHELSNQEGLCRDRILTLSQNGGDRGANRRI